MEADLQSIAAAGAATLVGVMATDAWGLAKEAFAALCGRNRADAVAELSAELDLDQQRVTNARRSDDRQAVAAVQSYWNDRLCRLMAIRPDAANDLDALVRRFGTVAVSPSHTFNVQAHDNARVYTSGRDMHISGDR